MQTSDPCLRHSPRRAPLSVIARVTLTLAVLLAALPARAALVDAVEFYNTGLDHYFITANPDEIGKLDTGFFTGWRRTGLSFKVAPAGTIAPGLAPVCRFYGSPAAGLDSHFYSASPVECQAVKDRFAGIWLFESDAVFEVALPDLASGACPGGTVPIYRAWNNRVDSNHRYTTDATVQQAMIAKGYIAEGYGSPSMPVVMCSPVVDPAVKPSCSLSASNGAPVVNTSVTLSATCTGSPTSYTWSGCSSTRSSCTATSGNAGSVTYALTAANANGSSVPVSIAIAWQPVPPPEAPPVCTLSVTEQTDPPTVGSLITLYAFCSGNPTAYQWTGCNTLTNLCRLRGNAAGGQTISVSGSNAGGGGNTASVFVNWVSAAPAPQGLCAQFPSALYSDVGDASTTVYSTFVADPPAFAWNGAWAIRFTVPATAQNGRFGSLAAAEFAGPPTYREVTVSSQACDFRPSDATGINGPLGRASGNSATLPFVIGASPGYPGLAAGQTYYFNVRNYIPGTGVSCGQAQQRCDALANISLPR